MGRVKNSLLDEQIDRLTALEVARDIELRFAQSDDSDAPSPSWELEFNEWLDAYEKSFGSRGDLS
jgi:hypothetical protein